MATVMLSSGAEVDSGSIEWRDECSARWRHVQNMRRLDRQGRRDYIANIERREGPEAAQRLKTAFMADWAVKNAPNVLVEPLAEGRSARTRG